MELVKGVRNVKAEMDIPQTQKVDLKYKIVAKNNDFIEKNISLIEHLAFLKDITQTEVKPAKSATAYVDESVEVYIPLGDYIDIDTEKQRLTKKLEKLAKDIELYNKKLSNKNFVEKADPDVVEKTKEDLIESEKKYQKLQTLLKEIS
jgi:valyl-tRNA synthetase